MTASTPAPRIDHAAAAREAGLRLGLKEDFHRGRPLMTDHTPPPIDPVLLQRRARRVRQATEALATVKRTLVSYIAEHALKRCESETAFTRCAEPADGILLVSCGHSAALCGDHLTAAYKKAPTATELTCTRVLPDLHAAPVHGVTVEWVAIP